MTKFRLTLPLRIESVTNRKSGRIKTYYDDRCVAVVPNTGHLLNEPQRTEEG